MYTGIEGVSAAVCLAETLVSCGLTTSKTGVGVPPTRRYLLGNL